MKNTSTWTLERRLAMGVLGRLAVEGVLADDMLDNGSANYFEFVLDTVGDGLRADLENLGVGTSLKDIWHEADHGRLYLATRGAS